MPRVRLEGEPEGTMMCPECGSKEGPFYIRRSLLDKTTSDKVYPMTQVGDPIVLSVECSKCKYVGSYDFYHVQEQEPVWKIEVQMSDLLDFDPDADDAHALNRDEIVQMLTDKLIHWAVIPDGISTSMLREWCDRVVDSWKVVKIEPGQEPVWKIGR